MKIREYRTEDCPQLARLFYDTVHSINTRDYTKEQVDAWADGRVDIDGWNTSFLEHYTLVAVDSGIVAGFGDIDAAGYLDRLYVHKDYQGMGVATMLCDRLESRFYGSRVTTHASITAKSFFINRGYSVISERQVERRGVSMINYEMEKKC